MDTKENLRNKFDIKDDLEDQSGYDAEKSGDSSDEWSYKVGYFKFM